VKYARRKSTDYRYIVVSPTNIDSWGGGGCGRDGLLAGGFEGAGKRAFALLANFSGRSICRPPAQDRWPTYIDFRPYTPSSLTMAGGSLWYRTDCGAVQSVLLGTVHSHVYRSGQLPSRSSAINGELQAGRNIICSVLTGVTLWPPRRPPWAACVHFLDLYPIDVSQLNSTFSVRYNSIVIYLGAKVNQVARLNFSEKI
jgi:hypothetical protein